MSKRTAVEIGILGYLNEWDRLSKETIWERLQHNFGNFHPVGYGALEPTMKELEAEGYIQLATEGEETFPDSETEHSYEITETGLERLHEKLMESGDEPLTVSAIETRIFKLGFIHHLPAEEQAAKFRELIDDFQTLRGRHVEILDEHDVETMRPFDQHGYRVALIELAVALLDTIIDWLEQRLVELEEVEDRDA